MQMTFVHNPFRLGILIFCSAFFLFLIVRASHEFRYCLWAPSDAYMVIAARHFHEEGFFFHKFLPFFNAGFLHDHILNNLPNGRYSHYPSLHALILGAVSKVSPEHIRFVGKVFASLFSTLALWFYFLFFCQVSSARVAFFSTVFIALSPVTMDLADSLAHHPLDECFRAITLFLTVRLASQWDQKKYLCLWFALFLMAANSVEYLPFALFFAGLVLFHKMSRRLYVLLLMSPVFSTLLHLAQIVWEWGSLKAASQSILSVVSHRIAGHGNNIHPNSGSYPLLLREIGRWLHLTLTTYGFRPLILAFFLMVIVSMILLRVLRQRFLLQDFSLCVFLFSSFAFLFLMPQQVVWIEPHYLRNFLPVLPALFILIVHFFPISLPSRWRPLFLGLLILAAFNPLAYAREVGSYLKKYPNLMDHTNGGISLSLDSVRSLCVLKDQIAEKTKYGDIILVPPLLRGSSGYRYSFEGHPVIESCWERRLVLYRNEEDLAYHRETFRRYRHDFAHKDPRVHGIEVYLLTLSDEDHRMELTLMEL